jgi:hypothetical protein
MIKPRSGETIVFCDDCDKPAFVRQIVVRHPGQERTVHYETHAESTHERRHGDALGRLDRFHEKVIRLEIALNQLSEADRELEYGILTEFDIATVKPSACNVRTDIKPSATVRFHHKTADVGLPPRPLKGQTVARLLREFRVAAGPVVTRLKEQFDRGR